MIVIETSAVVDALVGSPANPGLLALIADDELHAPSLIDYEVASALRGHVLAGKLSAERMDEAASDFAGLGIERYPLSNMLHDVLALMNNYTVYDAAYLVLARVLGVPLVTADTKLAGAHDLGIDVRLFRP